MFWRHLAASPVCAPTNAWHLGHIAVSATLRCFHRALSGAGGREFKFCSPRNMIQSLTRCRVIVSRKFADRPSQRHAYSSCCRRHLFWRHLAASPVCAQSLSRSRRQVACPTYTRDGCPSSNNSCHLGRNCKLLSNDANRRGYASSPLQLVCPDIALARDV